ncbi:AAA-domain-containing protein [Hypoxylon sp. FL1284]|nr:AAA-domain-containing protein [Hypoxylon sp. FL1284]
MHTLSARAFRLAALSIQKPNLATRSGRHFHASVVARAAENGHSGPSDDGSRPPDTSGAGGSEKGDEVLFGENATATDGEGQGRKRAGNGTLRSRTLRNRKREEFPPVPVPESFLYKWIYRFHETDDHRYPGLGQEREAALLAGEAPFPPWEKIWWEYNASLYKAVVWTKEALDEASKALDSTTDLESIRERSDILVASAFWAVAASVYETHGEQAGLKILRRHPVACTHLMVFFVYASKYHPRSPPTPDQARALMDKAMSERPLTVRAEDMYKEWMPEIIASVNTDLMIQPPKNVKLEDLRRPVTIIDVPDQPGFTIPREVVQHVATTLEADVLHLRAPDIAHIIGSYLGQDPGRAPGAISHLGYRAAENAGRLKANDDGDGDEGDTGETVGEAVQGNVGEAIQVPYALFMRDERFKKDSKRYITQMDDILNGSRSRGKNDELWEDLKINTALEELVHCADTEASKQRPLIIHIDDFNALNMDLDCGAIIINKIRKIVDGLWADGRKIALVGSCSSSKAPKPYMDALRELELAERVTHLYETNTSEPKATIFDMKRYIWRLRDRVLENEGNLVSMLLSMTEPPPEALAVSIGELGMREVELSELPTSWKSKILPVHEIYRVATRLIGSAKNVKDAFHLSWVMKGICAVEKLDQIKQELPKSKVRKGSLSGSRNQTDARKRRPSEDDHEEKVEAGLVNAKDIRTTFKDIHAPKETIESIKMLTTLSLIRPEAFSYGVLATDRIPGCLLYGPPGTGKTLLAKAVAKESGANMVEVSGASINNKYVGESEKNVRALFGLARKREPLVIFIDEADALLGSRGGRNRDHARETINQFLREWDGMDKTKAFIMVATNRPFDLDEAVLRRLPRRLLVDLPLEADRAAILRIHLRDEQLDPASVSVDDLARRTPLYSGSDLKNVCVAAAMAAVREEMELEEQHKQGKSEEGENEGRKRRVLAGRHFDRALLEVGASVSEDTATLTAIRKFDEKYGEGGSTRRRRRRGIGFEVVEGAPDAQEARVRSGNGR